MSNIQVAILMGSKSDLPLMEPAFQALADLGVACEMRVMSAHRTPERVREYVESAPDRGVVAFICGAGGAAHLAGAVAAHTTLPVIGVPLARTPLAGQDALLATVQMPSGMPVATVAIDGASNAGLLAAQIVAVGDPDLARRIRDKREERRARVIADDESIQGARTA
jgi:5-(carboxyamino)imidazole ribonucleotide mutase